MSAPEMLVSKVLMPERGVFLVRVDDDLALSGAVVSAALDSAAVVSATEDSA